MDAPTPILQNLYYLAGTIGSLYAIVTGTKAFLQDRQKKDNPVSQKAETQIPSAATRPNEVAKSENEVPKGEQEKESQPIIPSNTNKRPTTRSIAPSPDPVANIPEVTLVCLSEPPEGGDALGAGSYPRGQVVMLTAVAAPGWRFSGWSDGLHTDQNPNKLVMDADKTLRARFSRVLPSQFTLAARAEPAQAGRVTGAGRYNVGALANVEAVAVTGWRFQTWRGDLAGGETRQTIAMHSDKEAIALFDRVVSVHISVSADPPEGGTVTGGGPNPSGEYVTLRAIPSPLWRFIRWGGDEDGKSNPIKIHATGGKTMIAYFERTFWEEVDPGTEVELAQSEDQAIAAEVEKEKPARTFRGGAFTSQTEPPQTSAETDLPGQEPAPRTILPKWAISQEDPNDTLTN